MYIDPSIRSQRDSETRRLAIKQVAAARALLYFPSEATKIQLSKAAGKIKSVFSDLNPETKDLLIARTTYEHGVFSKGGAKFIDNAIERVRAKKGSGTDHAAVMAIISDFDWIFTDSKRTEHIEAIIDAVDSTPGLTHYTKSDRKRASRIAGSKTTAYGKKYGEEIKYYPGEIRTRGGVHGINNEVDNGLGISEKKRLIDPSWKWAEIEDHKVNQVVEPMVNHMSGSPLMTLIAFDMLAGESRLNQFVSDRNRFSGISLIDNNLSADSDEIKPVKSLQKKEKVIRSALTSAFLIGHGFHTGVENVEGILAYNGQSLRNLSIPREKDAGHYLGKGAATAVLYELMGTCCSPVGKQKLESFLQRKSFLPYERTLDLPKPVYTTKAHNMTQKRIPKGRGYLLNPSREDHYFLKKTFGNQKAIFIGNTGYTISDIIHRTFTFQNGTPQKIKTAQQVVNELRGYSQNQPTTNSSLSQSGNRSQRRPTGNNRTRAVPRPSGRRTGRNSPYH